VQATAIMSNPNTDPHAFEASPKIAEEVGAAALVVRNGLGYDGFMTQVERATENADRRSIDVQHLLGLPDSTPNPHLWYRPATMPAVAAKVARDLAALDPAHRSYFQGRAATFDRSLDSWMRAIQTLKADYPGAPVAVTEPVPDYLLQAAGLADRTPWELQAEIMNGVDLSPQNVTLEENLFRQHQVRVLLYNEQVTDSVTETFHSIAQESGIPVVGVYETMPSGYTYQSWMVAETQAIRRALSAHRSTPRLS
ncbi:MAG: metal ABC transporter solute-binding protein, Zn/Mn family, partial [Candidatus Dormibacteraceae bacterium]